MLVKMCQVLFFGGEEEEKGVSREESMERGKKKGGVEDGMERDTKLDIFQNA
jgi:hypothetical protein